MRVVVAGAGNVGTFLARDLTDRRHQVVLIEQEATVVAGLKADVPAATIIHGDACEPWVLEKAELARAEVMVSATGDDEDNLVISLLAKQEFAVPRVVARVNHPKNEWMFTESWGVDVAMSPPHILAALVEEAVTVGDIVKLFRLEKGRVGLIELTLPPEAAEGKHVYDLRLPHDCTLVAIVRDGHVIIPEPETPLVPGDEVLAIAATEAEDEFRRSVLGQT
ncbi:MAG TPA: TrkA family potassium uptake protein [Actinomycetota bacterium]